MAAIMAALVTAFVAFDKPTASIMTTTDEIGVVTTTYAPSGTFTKAYPSGSIVNAENDTITIPETLASAYQYSYQIRVTPVSGTKDIEARLEQIGAIGSTRWMPVDSVTFSGTGIINLVLKNANTWGVKHRLILDGTGTQSQTYNVDATLKMTR